MDLRTVHTPIQVAKVCIFKLQFLPFSGRVVYKITTAGFLKKENSFT